MEGTEGTDQFPCLSSHQLLDSQPFLLTYILWSSRFLIVACFERFYDLSVICRRTECYIQKAHWKTDLEPAWNLHYQMVFHCPPDSFFTCSSINSYYVNLGEFI